jgi:hypothetical protein
MGFDCVLQLKSNIDVNVDIKNTLYITSSFTIFLLIIHFHVLLSVIFEARAYAFVLLSLFFVTGQAYAFVYTSRCMRIYKYFVSANNSGSTVKIILGTFSCIYRGNTRFLF